MKTIEQLAQVAFEAHAKHTAGFATWRELNDNVRGGWVAAVQCVLAEVAVSSMKGVNVVELVDEGSVLSGGSEGDDGSLEGGAV